MYKIVIADDSVLLRRVLREALTATGRVEVIGEAGNGAEACEIVARLKPDVLILDYEMPIMSGLDALQKIMKENPVPVFIFSAYTIEGAAVTIKALELGAIDFLQKPTQGIVELKNAIPDLLAKIGQVATKGISLRLKNLKNITTRAFGQVNGTPVNGGVKLTRRKIDLIVMGSSTGGVQASMRVIPALPAGIPPMVWVQHMPAGFTASFATRANDASKINVKEGVDNDTLRPGTCYLARGGQQMRLEKVNGEMRLRVRGEEKVSGHCPSCDALFDSVSKYYGPAVLGIILTGMGDDGTRGLLQLRQKGAYVIGQNEESCVVYGMPRAAKQAGAVDIELDIDKIANAVIKLGGYERER